MTWSIDEVNMAGAPNGRVSGGVFAHEASMALKTLLEDNAPYNAKVTFHPDGRAGALGANALPSGGSAGVQHIRVTLNESHVAWASYEGAVPVRASA